MASGWKRIRFEECELYGDSPIRGFDPIHVCVDGQAGGPGLRDARPSLVTLPLLLLHKDISAVAQQGEQQLLQDTCMRSFCQDNSTHDGDDRSHPIPLAHLHIFFSVMSQSSRLMSMLLAHHSFCVCLKKHRCRKSVSQDDHERSLVNVNLPWSSPATTTQKSQ